VTKQLQGWDTYVEEATREPLELPMPDGDPILIRYPTGGQIRRAESATSTDEIIKIIFGDDDGERLIKLFEDAPGDVLRRIVRDVGIEFGVDVLTGNPLPSSNS
jgi:hypothetical protein